LKHLFAYTLFILFSIHSSEPIFIALNFKLNQDYYASICGYKDKPDLECNGCCHLKKQLIETEKENSNQEKQSNKKERQLYVQEIYLDYRITGFFVKEITNLSFIESFPFLYSYDIFHPPRR